MAVAGLEIIFARTNFKEAEKSVFGQNTLFSNANSNKIVDLRIYNFRQDEETLSSLQTN